MHCICCGKEVKPLPRPNGELNPDYVEPLGLDKYVNNTNWLAGVVDFICPGYGSGHDFTKLRITLCDDCITKGLDNGSIQDCGTYI